MRFSAHDVALREFTITAPQGMQVLAPLESGLGVLADIARSNARRDVAQAGGDVPVELRSIGYVRGAKSVEYLDRKAAGVRLSFNH